MPSRHNLKYWTRLPYIGFGVDAHSMLERTMLERTVLEQSAEGRASLWQDQSSQSHVRFATPDSLDAYMNRAPHTVTSVSARAAVEETFFLGLRLNRGIDLAGMSWERHDFNGAIEQSVQEGLLEQQGTIIRLTARGRLLSNEVFARFLIPETEENKSGNRPRESTLVDR
jgi:oxygen-independent coproporphyrinogen-3 oxidase